MDDAVKHHYQTLVNLSRSVKEFAKNAQETFQDILKLEWRNKTWQVAMHIAEL
jgi:hypothetical protein